MKYRFWVILLGFVPGLCTWAIPLYAQGNLYTSSGKVSFFSETPTENITAVNNKAQVVLNPSTGEIAVRMKMTDFSFRNKLMQEHFNENYMESYKYPTGTFSGRIEPQIDFSKDGVYQASAEGSFTVHGVSRPHTLRGTVTVRNGKVSIASDFDVALSDHRIEVPTIVFIKIAQVIKVTAAFELQKK